MTATLDYMDQASFLGLRALGHGPVNQFVWIYRRPADLAALRRFHAGLGRGLLGRRVETSPLPFGRHRWVRAETPEWELYADELSPDRIGDWLDAQSSLPLDPEHGPGWRLLARRLSGGGTVVVLLVSHTVADGLGTCEAVAHAVAGTGRTPLYSAPGSRPRWRAIRRDAARTLISLPEAGRAAAAALALSRTARDASAGPGPPFHAVGNPAAAFPAAVPVVVPSALLTAPADLWRRRARELHGSTTALVAALAALVGDALGRSAADGTVRLVLPVSLRQPGDLRGNALSSITVGADPRTVTRDLSPLRTAIAVELTRLSEQGNALAAPIALAPFIPRRLARRLEGMAIGEGHVGCSHLGVLPAAANRPDGTDTDAMFVRSLEALTRDDLGRLGGTARVASLVAGGQMQVSIAGWHNGEVESRTALAERVAAAAAELGLAFSLR